MKLIQDVSDQNEARPFFYSSKERIYISLKPRISVDSIFSFSEINYALNLP